MRGIKEKPKSKVTLVTEKGKGESTSKELIDDNVGSSAYKWFWENASQIACHEDNGRDKEARRIMREYAVTQLPFAIISDEDGQEYATVYSEEGPITLDRINEKI